MAVVGVELRRAGRELPVQRVHQRRVDAVGHRERREPAVVVNDVKPVVVRGEVDLVERPRDVVGLIQ